MPYTKEERRERNKKWRELNRERYNELQRKYSNAYNAKHREERRIYRYNYDHRVFKAPILSLEEFIDQFEDEDFEE